MREYNTDVDYGFTAVSTIEEDLDAQPQDKDVKKKKGTQPKKYYKDLSKGEKEKRADYFKSKDTTKNDNRPAPGDKGAKTKPSIHTKKFKKMFGEFKNELVNRVKESTDIGNDYYKHTSTITPGEPDYPGFENPTYKPSQPGSGDNPKVKRVKGFLERETDKPSEKDVKEWAATESTMNKYRERYKEQWEAKLKEAVAKMIEKV